MSQKIEHSVRFLAFQAIEEILDKKHFSNVVVNRYLKKTDLNTADKRLFTNLVNGVVFYDLRLDYELTPFLNLNKTPKKVLLIIKLAIFQMFYLTKIPDYAVINETINITKVIQPKSAKFVTAVLHNARRKGLRSLDLIKGKNKRLAIEFSMPQWLVDKMVKELGLDKTKSILSSLTIKPKMSLRTNTKFISRDDLLERLNEEFPDNFYASELSEVGIISKLGNAASLPEFKEGLFTIQDESSQLTVPNLLIQPSDIVLDACAAPGGKTTHIAQYLDPKLGGVVHAFDISENKRDLIMENATRMHLTDVIKVHIDKAENIRSHLPEVMFDKILVDAPCTGFGLLRRKPEVKYNHSKSDIMSSQLQQIEILEKVSLSLRSGGMLLYSTCTMFKEETTEVIKKFLEQNSDFVLLPLKYPINVNRSMLQIYPDDYQTDGFFISLLQKC